MNFFDHRPTFINRKRHNEFLAPLELALRGTYITVLAMTQICPSDEPLPKVEDEPCAKTLLIFMSAMAIAFRIANQ
jgi:hypothetical protein